MSHPRSVCRRDSGRSRDVLVSVNGHTLNLQRALQKAIWGGFSPAGGLQEEQIPGTEEPSPPLRWLGSSEVSTGLAGVSHGSMLSPLPSTWIKLQPTDPWGALAKAETPPGFISLTLRLYQPEHFPALPRYTKDIIKAFALLTVEALANFPG